MIIKAIRLVALLAIGVGLYNKAKDSYSNRTQSASPVTSSSNDDKYGVKHEYVSTSAGDTVPAADVSSSDAMASSGTAEAAEVKEDEKLVEDSDDVASGSCYTGSQQVWRGKGHKFESSSPDHYLTFIDLNTGKLLEIKVRGALVCVWEQDQK